MTNAKLPNIEVMNIVKVDKLTKQQTWGGGGGAPPPPPTNPNHILKLFWKKKELQNIIEKF
jgi:hypothetical protein